MHQAIENGVVEIRATAPGSLKSFDALHLGGIYDPHPVQLLVFHLASCKQSVDVVSIIA
jgi:hypothetical protein